MAQCRMATTGAGCAQPRFTTVAPTVEPERELGPPPVALGEILPRGKYSILVNRRYYGLPPVEDGWVYMRIENDVYRVDYATRKVLQRVTDQTSANFP